MIVRFILVLLATLTALNANAGRSSNHITLHKPDTRKAKSHQTNDLFKSYLELSSFRHKILAQNVANINTPRYKADDVDIPEEYDEIVGKGKLARKISMSCTSSQHLGGSKGSSGKFSSHKLKDPYEIKKNGNNVSMNQQMTKIAQNKNEYNAALKGYATLNSLYGTVVGK
jgi:flagellar basal-body rod protein FlgB